MTWVWIAIGGAGGAVARYGVDLWVSARTGGTFPWGTLVINVSGSLLVGLLAALILERSVLSPELRAPLMIGFLGAYTTFSTWMLESWRLVEAGDIVGSFANIVGSVVLGCAAVVAGMFIGRAV